MVRISWIDRRTNESILQALGTQLELMKIVRERKLKYFGHVVKAQNLCTRILEGRVNDRRSKGDLGADGSKMSPVDGHAAR